MSDSGEAAALYSRLYHDTLAELKQAGQEIVELKKWKERHINIFAPDLISLEDANKELWEAQSTIKLLAENTEELFSIWCIAEHALEDSDYERVDKLRSIAKQYTGDK